MLTSTVGPETIAIPVAFVEEVTLAAALAAVGGARPPALGYLDLRGDTVLVVDGFALLDLPAHPLAASDRFIVLSTPEGRLAVRVDRVIGLEPIQAIRSERLVAEGLGCRLWPGRAIAADGEEAVLGILDVEATVGALAGVLSATS